MGNGDDLTLLFRYKRRDSIGPQQSEGISKFMTTPNRPT
jgi:hypothetical protein